MWNLKKNLKKFKEADSRMVVATDELGWRTRLRMCQSKDPKF
jgi:hypothetical protein